MIRRLACLVAVVLAANDASAQTGTIQSSSQEQKSDTAIVINQKHYIRQGNVELRDPVQKSVLFADQVEFFEDEDRAIATGNVVLSQGNNRIAAERAEFNTKTWLGTFYNASGIATVQPQKQTVRPGTIAPPPVSGQDTVVYFFGETVEKVGPKKYKIIKGGFSSCVQPTPRWDMTATSVLLNLDHYTFMKNAVMTVKGVPMLYFPVMYYPTNKDGRATGFLIPTYGASTLRGQSLHNAFFWAIDRSQDATIAHDWYSKIGQGVGGEYRYNFGGGSDGTIRTYLLDQKETSYVLEDGSQGDTIPASRSYEIHGNANQTLPGNLRLRGRIDYFSSIVTSQTFNTNVYDLSRNQRSYGGNLVGAWNAYSLNATFDHSEYFYDANNSVLSGGWPRIAVSRNERPIFNSDFYFTMGTEFAHLLSQGTSTSTDPNTNLPVTTVNDQTLNRFDFFPQVRYPFKKWGWLTANSTVAWRDTFYSRILSPYDPTGAVPQHITDESYNRQFFNFQTQIVGPVFNRIWDTPDNNYAEKFKHTIEPSLMLQKTTNVDDPRQLVYFDGTDAFVGGTQVSYALTNRFYAKRKLAPGQPAVAREIVTVDLRQSYYNNPEGAAFDHTYQSTLVGGGNPSNFSPIALSVRAAPSNTLSSTMTAEFDSHYYKLRLITINGTYSWSQQVQASVGWSKKGFIEQLPGFNDPTQLDDFINASTNIRTRDNKYGVTYSMNYDILRSAFLQQQMTGFYNAQCCGLAVQYMVYNNPYAQLPSDHRFFLSFTLAGLGNFSPFNGALSGVPR
ncbi:MAG TPA: LptA/OstA family protein [Vicinamibacterales bacterium]